MRSLKNNNFKKKPFIHLIWLVINLTNIDIYGKHSPFPKVTIATNGLTTVAAMVNLHHDSNCNGSQPHF